MGKLKSLHQVKVWLSSGLCLSVPILKRNPAPFSFQPVGESLSIFSLSVID